MGIKIGYKSDQQLMNVSRVIRVLKGGTFVAILTYRLRPHYTLPVSVKNCDGASYLHLFYMPNLGVRSLISRMTTGFIFTASFSAQTFLMLTRRLHQYYPCAQFSSNLFSSNFFRPIHFVQSY